MITNKPIAVAAIVAKLLSSVAVSAFTVVAPPSVAVAAPAPLHVPSVIVSLSSQLPVQQELLQKASSSTIAPATTATGSVITISSINYDGKVPTTEADEYVVVTNTFKNEMDVSGYYVFVATTSTQGPTFTFPKVTILKPGQSVRIYTNEIHKETGGYSFGSGKAIWNNKGGLAVLKNGSGATISEFKYKVAA
jgi:Lamin Tail Domain